MDPNLNPALNPNINPALKSSGLNIYDPLIPYKPHHKENLYCESCKVRPKEFRCDDCDIKICRACSEEHHCQVDGSRLDIPAIMLFGNAESRQRSNIHFNDRFDDRINDHFDGRPDNINLETRAQEYFSKEIEIINEHNAKRVKQLEERNKELEEERSKLSERLQNLEIEYRDTLFKISEASVDESKLTEIMQRHQQEREEQLKQMAILEAKNKELQDQVEKKLQEQLKDHLSQLSPRSSRQGQNHLPRVATLEKPSEKQAKQADQKANQSKPKDQKGANSR